MDGLIAFYRARLDEAERAARRGQLTVPRPPGFEGLGRECTAELHEPVKAHVLADIEAKRDVLKLYEAAETNHRERGTERAHAELDALRDVLRALSGEHAAHPDYKAAWRF